MYKCNCEIDKYDSMAMVGHSVFNAIVRLITILFCIILDINFILNLVNYSIS